jgi:hypothetical protein
MTTPQFNGQRFLSPAEIKSRRRNVEDAVDFFGRAVVNEPEKYSDPVLAARAEAKCRVDYRKAKARLAKLDAYDGDWTPEYRAWINEQAAGE